MAGRVVVLGSGSTGNSTLIEADGASYLVDCGFGPRELSFRLASVGSSWQAIRAVLLTHTHTDHWNRYTLEHLRRMNIPLYLHNGHRGPLSNYEPYGPLDNAGLIREYDKQRSIRFTKNFSAQPVEVPHDCYPTFAFRFDFGERDAAGGWSFGLATDLGTVTDEFLKVFHGVEVLAIEFNHDVRMERTSRRPRDLVDRVLSDIGHLSNRQAADAVELLAACGSLQAVIPVHLSRDCNTPEHAARACRSALRGCREVAVHVSLHDQPTPAITIRPRLQARTLPPAPKAKRTPPRRTLMDFVTT